jgi:hypothetical protein
MTEKQFSRTITVLPVDDITISSLNSNKRSLTSACDPRFPRLQVMRMIDRRI